MAGRRRCGKCGEADHHNPNCPEMFWPDGHRRGTVHQEELDRLERIRRERHLEDRPSR